MLDKIYDHLIDELKFGYLKRKHPYKYCTLSSIQENKPQARTVVLRDMTSENQLIFYTDRRSDKIQQFQKNPYATALFYHPKKLWQVKISGKMKLVDDEETLQFYQRKVQGPSKKDYTTLKVPGTPIKNPDMVEYSEELNFTVLLLEAETIESLQLKRPNHIRCVFKKNDNWKGQFLVP